MTTAPTPMGSRDRISSAEDEQENAQALMLLLDDMLALQSEMNHWPSGAQPGSVLFGDDQATHPFPTSSEVRYLLVVAVDNLVGLRNMLIESILDDVPTLTLPPFAPYTLLRNAIECAGTALWLMEPKERHQRVFRTAQFALEDAKKNKAAFTSVVGTGASNFDRKKALIRTMIEPYAALSWKSVDAGFSVTGLLSIVGGLPQLQGLNPLGKWQIASGMAHGKRWAGTLLSDLKEATPPEPNGDSTFHVYGNFNKVLWIAGCARSLVAEASNQIIDKSQSAHAQAAQLPTVIHCDAQKG